MDGLTWALIAGTAVALSLAAVLLAGARRARRAGGLAPPRLGERRPETEAHRASAPTAADATPRRRGDSGGSGGFGGLSGGDADRERPTAGGSGASYEERHSAHWQDGRPELSEPAPDPAVTGLPDARERIERLRERRQDQAGIGTDNGGPDRAD